MLNRIIIGWDKREDIAYQVCKYSIKKNTNLPIKIIPLKQDILREEKLYKREYKLDQHNHKIDKIDGKPFSTDFSFTRFLVPFLANTGWVLFCDCDMLFRTDILNLIPNLNNKYACMVVKHNQQIKEAIKMDNQPQQAYPRKNWSSFIAWNLDHLAHSKLTVKDVNTKTGSWLHGFSWLDDDEIGELPIEWNYLVDHSPKNIDPKVVHFTLGGPWFDNYKNVEYADEWNTYKTEYEKGLKYETN